MNTVHETLLLGADYISTFPILFFFVNMLEAAKQGNYIENLFFSFWMFKFNGLVYFIKRLPYPDYLLPITNRPLGASNCDLLSRNGPKEWGTPGFPSGHMTSAALFSVYKLMKLYKEKGEPNLKDFILENYQLIIFYLTIILATAWARYYKKCHNVTQIIGGTIFGTVAAIIFYHLYFNVIKKNN